jgi:hypothetical protein
MQSNPIAFVSNIEEQAELRQPSESGDAGPCRNDDQEVGVGELQAEFWK